MPPTKEIAGRIPPQAIEMEKAVLGAVMIDSDSFVFIRDLLDETCFYRPTHATIFTAMSRLDGKQKPIDLLTMTEELRRMEKLEEIGNELYLAQLTEVVPSSASIEHYARQVLEKALLRRIISLTATISSDSYEPLAESQTLLEKLQTQLIQLTGRQRSAPVGDLRTDIRRTLDHITNIKAKGGYITGIGTGFDQLDNLTTGLQNGELIVIAARPSVGKTTLALDIARNAAKDKCGVAFFSLEMDTRQLIMRLLANESCIDSLRLRSTVKLRNGEPENLAKAAEQLAEIPFCIDDTPNISIANIRIRARQLWMQHRIGLVVLDYLQLVRPPKATDNQQQWIAHVSASMKTLAKELRIPIIVLSQLSRAPEQRGGEHKPVLSDLRDSGAIEQDADIVIFLFRPELYPQLYKNQKYKFGNREYDIQGLTEVIVAKNRNGPTGNFLLSFVKKYTSFKPHTGEIPPPNDSQNDEELPF